MRQRALQLTALLLATFLVAALAAVSHPGIAQANGRVIDFQRKVAGPYEIALGTLPPSPAPGNLHLTMTITEVASRALVLDAAVTVTGTGPGAAAPDIGPLTAGHTSADTKYYDINTSVDREGTWSFTVAISGKAGDGAAEFQIEVVKSNPLLGLLTLALLLALAVVIALAMRKYFVKRPKPLKDNKGKA